MRDIVVSFIFDIDGSVELVLGEEQEHLYDGWSISPHAFPSSVRNIIITQYCSMDTFTGVKECCR